MTRAGSNTEDLAPWWAVAAWLALAALLLTNVGGFGIWDPWELEAADAARRVADGASGAGVHGGIRAAGLGFALFGVDEWTGRAPIAVGGLIAAALAYALVAHFSGRRAGLYSLVIVGTSPLFVFNARAMLGEAPSFALQAALALCAAMACFSIAARPIARLGWLAATLGLVIVGVEARGALLCVLPPVGAVAVVAAADGRLSRATGDSLGALSAFTLWGLTLMVGGAVALDVIGDASSYSPWLGGSPRGGQPPPFDYAIERTFHAFAPWSMLLPLALVRMPITQDDGRSPGEWRLRMLLLIWAALGYGAQTLFLSRYGDATAYLPVVALAGMVALLLRDVERSSTGQWPAAIAIAMLGGLLIRDYSLYPAAPIHGMAIGGIEVPKVFNPKLTWGALLGTFTAVAVLAVGAGAQPGLRRSALSLPFRFVATQWRRGFGHRTWIVGIGGLVLALEVVGVLALLRQLGTSSLAVKWGGRLLWTAPAVVLAVIGAQLLLKLFAGERARSLPILLAGVAVGCYAAHGFMPALSSHFSPREVYETYNALAADGEALGEFKVGGRAAAYYAKGEVVELESTTALGEYLGTDARRWAVFPESELPAVNRAFRRRHKRHIFVADARSARVLLASNQPIEGRTNGNFLVDSVVLEVPSIQHRVDANLDGKIILLGYDLKLPHGDYVGTGEKFELTWYYRVVKHAPGNWRVFVHIDGAGKRIHGDHYPLDGRYPVNMWEPGDVIINRQELEVPVGYPNAPFTIFTGLYSGETRMRVVEGPKDEEDRIRAGVLRIR